MRCIAHILNLIFGDGLSKFNVSVSRVRGAVKYIRSGPSRLSKFKKCAVHCKILFKGVLCLDVPTRWNSTFLMLDVALKYEKAFDAYDDIDPMFKTSLSAGENAVGIPGFEDWDKIRRLCLFLKQFYDLTLKISGTKYATANLWFDDVCYIYSSLNACLIDDDFELSMMARKMKDKFEKYWGTGKNSRMNYLLFVGAVFDPRKKFGFLKFGLVEMYGELDGGNLFTSVKKCLFDLFGEYSRLVQAQSRKMNNFVYASNKSVCLADDDDDSSGFKKPFFSKYKKIQG